MMFNQYPYLNVNDLNLDYILSQLKIMMNEVTNFVSINAIKYADPIQWDITRQYEKNTVVIDPVTGTAYISVAPVPAGVALTRPEYWTVVFDLGSFVTRAAQNFTSRYEQETTLTATFPTNTGEWLVWGDVLYKAKTNITAGDTYVVDGNIEHFTIEDLYNAYLNTIANILAIVGDLADLTTSDTSDIVHAVNSVLDDLNITIGNLANLNTADKTNIVNAINEIVSNVGNLDDLINDIQTTFHAVYLDGVNGDDNNDGTLANPMKTPDAAIKKYSTGSLNLYFVSAGTYNVTRSVEGLLQFEISNPQNINGVIVDISNYYETKRVKLGSNSDAVGITFNFNGMFNPCHCRVEMYHAHLTGGNFEPQASNCFMTDCTFDVQIRSSQGDMLINDCTFNQPITFSYGRLRTNNNLTFNSTSGMSGTQFIMINGGYWDVPNPPTLSGTMNGTYTYGILLSGGVITFASRSAYDAFKNLLGDIHSYRGIISIGAVEIYKNCPQANDVRYYSGGFQNYIVSTDTWNYLNGQVRHVTGGLQYYDSGLQDWVNI